MTSRSIGGGKHRVTCSCGFERVVSAMTLSRIRRGLAPAECRDCRRVTRANSRVTEISMLWWVERFGGSVPAGQTIASYVRSPAAPRELTELLASYRG